MLGNRQVCQCFYAGVSVSLYAGHKKKRFNAEARSICVKRGMYNSDSSLFLNRHTSDWGGCGSGSGSGGVGVGVGVWGPRKKRNSTDRLKVDDSQEERGFSLPQVLCAAKLKHQTPVKSKKIKKQKDTHMYTLLKTIHTV